MIHFDHIKTNVPEWTKGMESMADIARGLELSSPGNGFHALCKLMENSGAKPIEYVTAATAAMYSIYGQQAFKIGPRMREMLARTDLSNVPISDIHTPYPSFYIDLGNTSYRIWGGERTKWHTVAGMYVVSYESEDPSDGMVMLILAWGPENERSLEVGDDATGYAGLVLNQYGDVEESITRLMSRENDNDQEDASGMEISPDQYNDERKEIFRALFRIAINLSLYLSTEDAEVESVPNEELKRLRSKVSNAKNPGKKKKYATRLSKISSCNIKIIAPSIEKAVSMASGDRAAHWVRGHWHTYLTGQARSNRIRKWVRPFIRGAGESEAGHRYDISEINGDLK